MVVNDDAFPMDNRSGCESIAGKPAPTVDWLRTRNSASTNEHCGSGLARESVGPVDIDVECAAAFASKPAPTGFSANLKIV
jgi:hypothetical protein